MSPEQEKIDEFLETALGSYSEVEPRVGFEARILANLRTTPVRPRWQMRFVYAGAAMVMVGAVLYGVWRKELAITGIPSQPSPATVASHVKAPDVTPVLLK